MVRFRETPVYAQVARAGLPGINGFQINRVGLTGLPNGGVQATVNYFGEVAFDIDGTFRFVHSTRGGGAPSADWLWYHSPHARASAPDGSLVPLGSNGLLNCCSPLSAVSYTGPPWGGSVFNTSQTMPVVFADRGTVVWMYSAGVLVSSCLADGATRWVVEWDTPPGDYRWPTAGEGYVMMGLPDGSVVADLGMVARIDSEGNVLASRYPEPTPWASRSCVGEYPAGGLVDSYVAALHPECGVLLHGGYWSVDDSCNGADAFWEWWRLDDFSTIAHVAGMPDGIPAGTQSGPWVQTSECQVIRPDFVEAFPGGPRTWRLVSIGQDVSTTWSRELDAGSQIHEGSNLIPTADGGLLVLDAPTSGSYGARLLSFSAEGLVDWSRTYGGDEVGAVPVPYANVLLPDGLLWFAATNEPIDGDWLLTAVETNERPAWFPDGNYRGGGTWARTAVVVEDPSAPDAGVADAGASEDAGTD